MNFTDCSSSSQMFLAPKVHPTRMQSTFRVKFIGGNVSDILVPNQAFLLQCSFTSDLNPGAPLHIEVVEAYVCVVVYSFGCQGKSFCQKSCKEKPTGVTT